MQIKTGKSLIIYCEINTHSRKAIFGYHIPPHLAENAYDLLWLEMYIESALCSHTFNELQIDHFHFIDFLGWLACVFLLVRGHFAPFRFIFGFLLLPLVSVCCSNHDCQLLTKYDISSSDSFSVWRKIANEKLNLQRSLGLAQPSWESCCHG